jgi:hypothetical protein
MDKFLGIFLMIVFGISGLAATGLAWFCPWLQLDKTQATIAGLIGMGFILFQSLKYRHESHNEEALTAESQGRR